MEKIITYKDLPASNGKSVYLRMEKTSKSGTETDPKLYMTLISKGYKIIGNICDCDESTIYITGKRQSREYTNYKEYKEAIDNGIQSSLRNNSIEKPATIKFSYVGLINHKYKLPFVLKNENQNGGKEKFLINTEEDYEKLISACNILINKRLLSLTCHHQDDIKAQIDYSKYLDLNFTIQEYIKTPSEYNTTVRLLTTPNNCLLYAALKYNEAVPYHDNTTLLGYLLSEVFPLSTNSIVSNTLSGGKNILIGENEYYPHEKELLNSHNINSEQFHELIGITEEIHKKYKTNLGIICGFDYIYDVNKSKWFLLEYHSRPMVGDYVKRQGLNYETNEDKIRADGLVRATALKKCLTK